MSESSTDPRDSYSASTTASDQVSAEPGVTAGDTSSRNSTRGVRALGSRLTRRSPFAGDGVLASTPAKVIAAATGVALLLSGVGVVLTLTGPPDTPAAKRESSRGFTTTVTVPVYPVGAAVAAQPRPSQLPPLIQADGDCKVQLDILRDLFDRVPSGLMPLSKDDQKILNEQLTKIGPPGPGQSAACSPQTAQLFRQQELGPWLVWQPPAATAPAPAAPAPAKSSAPAPAPATASPSASTTASPSASVKR